MKIFLRLPKHEPHGGSGFEYKSDHLDQFDHLVLAYSKKQRCYCETSQIIDRGVLFTAKRPLTDSGTYRSGKTDSWLCFHIAMTTSGRNILPLVKDRDGKPKADIRLAIASFVKAAIFTAFASAQKQNIAFSTLTQTAHITQIKMPLQSIELSLH